jgi:RNA-directed DNA polymerase
MCHGMKARPHEARTGASPTGVARSAHGALWATPPASPGRRRPRTAWLTAGLGAETPRSPPTAGPPHGGTRAPWCARLARHGRAAALPPVSPQARVSAAAADCGGLHEERQGLAPGHQRRMTWRADIGLPRKAATRRLRHPVAGAQPGGDFWGGHRRQERVGPPPSGQHATGNRLGVQTLRPPAQATRAAQGAARGRRSGRGTARSQGALLPQRHPTRRGWAPSSRTRGSPAVWARRDVLTGEKRRRGAHRRPPTPSAGWRRKRSWPQLDHRGACAPAAPAPPPVPRLPSRGVPSTRPGQGRGNRSPYDGAWVYGSTRQGRPPNASPRRAQWLKAHHGRCRHCGVFCPHADRSAGEQSNGARHTSRSATLQALHGHGPDAKTREQGDSRPRGRRDKHQDTAERRDRKRSCAVLKQR